MSHGQPASLGPGAIDLDDAGQVAYDASESGRVDGSVNE
jgi:hypothetical protein